jgi:hypothetical protein
MFVVVFLTMFVLFLVLVSKPEDWLCKCIDFVKEQNVHNG